MASSDSSVSEDQLKYQGHLQVPSLLNQVFFVSRNGTKQIVIGHRVEKDFPVIILFYKLDKPQSGLELSVQEWNELVQSKSSIREFLRKGTHKPTILLGSVNRAVEFGKYYSKRTVVIKETVPPAGYHPRQIALQEPNWANLQSAFPAINQCIDFASSQVERIKFIFNRICQLLVPHVANYDNEGVKCKLAELTCADVLQSVSQSPTPDDLIIFTQLQHHCKDFIFDHILAENTGVGVLGGY